MGSSVVHLCATHQRLSGEAGTDPFKADTTRVIPYTRWDADSSLAVGSQLGSRFGR